MVAKLTNQASFKKLINAFLVRPSFLIRKQMIPDSITFAAHIQKTCIICGKKNKHSISWKSE